MAGLKIRKGDTVEVIAGKEEDRGQRGTVLVVDPVSRRVVVEGRNLVKKHSRPRPVKGTRGAQMTPGGILTTEASLEVSNVMVVCPSCDRASRLGFKFLEDGRKVRVCKRCASEVDA